MAAQCLIPAREALQGEKQTDNLTFIHSCNLLHMLYAKVHKSIERSEIPNVLNDQVSYGVFSISYLVHLFLSLTCLLFFFFMFV